MRLHDEGLEFTPPGLPPVRLHPGLVVVALVLAVPFWFRFTVSGLWVTALVVPGFVLSVLAHELGHALVGQRFGLRPVLIRLHLMGGEAVLLGQARTWWEERRVILAGPLVNLGLGAACLAVAWLLAPGLPGRWARYWPYDPGVALRAAHWLGWANLALAGVNLLPALPLDGGRLLEGVLEQRWGERRALFWVGLSGTVLAGLATVIFFTSTVAGMPIWSPPRFAPNWAAFQAGRGRRIFRA